MLRTALALLGAACAAASFAGGGQEWIYQLRPGDTLFDLSHSYLRNPEDWQRLQRHNGVTRDRAMPPGTPVRIPLAWLRAVPAEATVSIVQGRGEVVSGSDGGVRPAQPGMKLAAGDRVRTGPDGSLSIELADGSRILIQASTDMTLETATAYSGTDVLATRLRLSAGRIESAVARQRRPASRHEITTPTAHLGVRGTTFRTAVDADANVTRSEVLEGEVGVAGAPDRAAIPVAGGFGTIVDSSRRPAPPVALLPAPDLSAIERLQERPVVRFKFPALAGSVGYRAQIAPDERFDRILSEGKFAAPEVKFDGLPDGDYVLRVRGVDARELEGKDTRASFRLKARPEPPFATVPPDKAKLRATFVDFEWSQASGAASYHFQLASDPAFGSLVSDLSPLQQARARSPEPLAPGHYYWRVASVDAGGDHGPYGDVRSITLKPLPADPEPASIDDTQVHLLWSAEPGQRFRLQLARDAQFADVLTDLELDRPRTALPKPEPGTYYFRIRATDPDGYVGPYTTAQRIEVPYPPPPWWLMLFLVPVIL